MKQLTACCCPGKPARLASSVAKSPRRSTSRARSRRVHESAEGNKGSLLAKHRVHVHVGYRRNAIVKPPRSSCTVKFSDPPAKALVRVPVASVRRSRRDCRWWKKCGPTATMPFVVDVVSSQALYSTSCAVASRKYPWLARKGRLGQLKTSGGSTGSGRKMEERIEGSPGTGGRRSCGWMYWWH